ncbi:Guided entry of tail-anchored protein 1 [Myriangium duriaei CBS 260.36]|uniref:Guided entry of tail-anchored protein 1 n=1 Tax=Myriangium duriaei CBS 260.36 TaxID=1168546 RepID=A0A9P4J6N0_9PEZI|nr:Guided entry of tail-anchored protein 1 [Myriangium duriaei CBS 260.36]
MLSLLLLPFLVQLAIHLVNTFGAATINELLWTIFSKFPTQTSRDATEADKLRREVVRLKRELAGVSAQDEFSKWAKLRRQHDKVAAEHEKISSGLTATRGKFDTAANGLRWAGTTGLRFVLQFWFSKRPMFWIPRGWVPGYVEWLLAFPRAPTGAVSMQVWWIACASVIALVGEALGATVVLVSGKRREKIAMASGTGTHEKGKSTTGQSTAEKKEL